MADFVSLQIDVKDKQLKGKIAKVLTQWESTLLMQLCFGRAKKVKFVMETRNKKTRSACLSANTHTRKAESAKCAQWRFPLSAVSLYPFIPPPFPSHTILTTPHHFHFFTHHWVSSFSSCNCAYITTVLLTTAFLIILWAYYNFVLWWLLS